ncbi:MAG: hypothetical protein PHQ23_11820 [Candidatus Wallbacteria bacterium]|nr:hypothetical protein [Candidatus Wallbacteria bacterium]
MKVYALILLIFCATPVLSFKDWEKLIVSEEFNRRFPLVEVTPSPRNSVPEGGLTARVHFRYSTFEYSGIILRCYLLFKTGTYIYLGSDYRYFYGNGEMVIDNYFYLPRRLFNKDVDRLLMTLMYTVDPVNDYKREIARWEYRIAEGQ